MIIKCINNKTRDLPDDIINSRFTSYDTLHLNKAEIYVVYSMNIYFGYVWYFTIRKGINYPLAYPSPAFEIVDGRLSRYWIFSTHVGRDTAHTRSIWTFPEWANEESFYEALTDAEERETKIFKRYKELMDLEFPNPSITLSAEILDDQWLLCPTCIDAWESTSKDGMVICPKCKQMMHNPRYKDEEF